MPLILEPTTANISRAAEILRRGGVVAFPTETVYGLGGDTFSVAALETIYTMKGRPANNPLIAHVIDAEQARRLIAANAWNDQCERLAEVFWPGPLTLVLPKSPSVPPQATAGLKTIAVRSPAHPVARQLLESLGSPISAPSANRSGGVSPTLAEHVKFDFADQPDLVILDGGACEVGIESKVLDLSASGVDGMSLPRVLRPGSVSAQQLQEILAQKVEVATMTMQGASPGTTLSHYSPRTACELVASEDLRRVLEEQAEPAAVLCFTAKFVPSPHKPIQMIRNAKHYASALYKTLRKADEMNCARIIIEEPPKDNGLWTAVHDRLRRAISGY